MRWALALVLVGLAAVPAASQGDPVRAGHSRHGPAFDRGPRRRPQRMEGIGRVSFPLTSTVPEVKAWFEQGLALLHGYWFFEAERAFRWCHKLDPDCAMAYWGLALSTFDGDRASAFHREAMARMAGVSPRERLYLRALDAMFGSAEPPRDGARRTAAFRDAIQDIVLAFPEDLEARALLGNYNRYVEGWDRFSNGLLLQGILEEAPDHPGALHYLVHNWDGRRPDLVLEPAERSATVASASGHAHHMAGHVYAATGRWHEAAIALDRAARVEARYLLERRVMPFQDWDYAHNRNYLGLALEHLGRADASLAGARDLLASPRDPRRNSPAVRRCVYRQGLANLIRVLVRFERWEEILSEDGIPVPTTDRDRRDRHYMRSRAAYASGDRELGESERKAHGRVPSPDDDVELLLARVQETELEAWAALGHPDSAKRGEGVALMERAARLEARLRERRYDPPIYPRVLWSVLGDVQLRLDRHAPAAASYRRALELVPNDGESLSGLARACAALGETEAATRAWHALQRVWSDADPGLPAWKAAEALGLPAGESVAGDALRSSRAKLDDVGPARWAPPEAPPLESTDPTGRRRSLAELRGRNVLLVFYLGSDCLHCMEQLVLLVRNHRALDARDVTIVAVSPDTSEETRIALAGRKLPIVFLSDPELIHARRFDAYDDFEEIELHATFLIDREGKMRWGRRGGEPFTDVAFLLRELDRISRDSK